MGLHVPATMDDELELELELELLAHVVTANLDPVHTNPGKYRNAYIFLRLAFPSTLKVVITLNSRLSFIGELIWGNSTFRRTLSFWVAMVTPQGACAASY